MHKLKIMAAIAAMLVTSPALAQEITVWDVNVDDAAHATYYDHAKAAFEAAHPGATLNLPVTAGRRILHAAGYGACFENRSGRDLGQWRCAGQEPDRRPDPARRQAARPDLQAGRKIGIHRPRRQALLHPDDAAGPRRLLQQGALQGRRPRSGQAADHLGRSDQDVRRLQGAGQDRLLHDGQQGRL